MLHIKTYKSINKEKIEKILKNKKNFLKNIWLSYIINYYTTYLNYMKIHYFLIVYKSFLKIPRLIMGNIQLIKRRSNSKSQVNKLTKDIAKEHRYLEFTYKFKIFNYYCYLFSAKRLLNGYTSFCLYPKVRNFYLSISKKRYGKVWSVGMFLKKYRLRYKISAQKSFIKFFLNRIAKNISRYIILKISSYTKKNKLFFNLIRWKMKFLNRKLYKTKFLRLKKFRLVLKFKLFTKKNRKKPNKKKSMRKKHRWYIY